MGVMREWAHPVFFGDPSPDREFLINQNLKPPRMQMFRTLEMLARKRFRADDIQESRRPIAQYPSSRS